MNGFFGAVWRFNAIVIAVVGILMIGAGLRVIATFAPDARPQGANGPAPFDVEATADQSEMRTGPFIRIEGTPLLSAELYDNATSNSVSSRRGELDNTRNIFIYDAASRETWPLFPESNPLILDSKELYSSGSGDKEFIGLFIEYVDEDRNGDNRNSVADGFEIALFDASLRSAVKVEKVFWTASDPAIIGNEIIAIGEDDDVMTAIHINLASREVEMIEYKSPVASQ